MKTYLYILLTAFFISTSISSCCTDDEISTKEEAKKEVVSPKYSEYAAKYVLSSGAYSSIELTGSGDYIAVKRSVTRATNDENIITGTFTISSDGTVKLSGIGEVTINDNGTAGVVLNIEGEDYQASVTKNIDTSDAEDWLYRTWYIVKYSVIPAKNDGLRLTVNTAEQLNKLLNQYGYNLPAFETLIITKCGTFLPTYNNGCIKNGTWKWSNESKKKISFTYNVGGETIEGVATISGDGNEIVISHTSSAGTLEFTFDARD